MSLKHLRVNELEVGEVWGVVVVGISLLSQLSTGSDEVVLSSFESGNVVYKFSKVETDLVLNFINCFFEIFEG